mmetsp:Transcript_17539/g.28698  ORF Transcript_17539/g.28698 Transcript_17539/m.28698 type:complete len:288 (+) Transcript_17539:50-913(+)
MASSWQTIRLRNADGTSTVYRVHDSVNTHDHNVYHSSSSMASSISSLPPEVILGGSAGSTIHHYGRHPVSPMSASSMGTTAYSAHSTPPHGQSPVVILKPTKKRRKSNTCGTKCSTSNNPLCITVGVVLSLLVIIGYVSLIVVLIPGSTKNRWNEDDVLSSMATAGNQNNSRRQQQQQQIISKQNLIQKVSIGQATSPMTVNSSSSGIDGTELPRGGHSYNAIVTILDGADDPQPIGQSSELLKRDADHRVSQKSDNADEPVRRLRMRRRRQKTKLMSRERLTIPSL